MHSHNLHAGGGGGGPDYSAQWAEYYRSIGKVLPEVVLSNSVCLKPLSQFSFSTLQTWFQILVSIVLLSQVKEAEAIESQMRAKGPGGPQPPQPGQQPQYPGDYFGSTL